MASDNCGMIAIELPFATLKLPDVNSKWKGSRNEVTFVLITAVFNFDSTVREANFEQEGNFVS